MDSCRVPGRQTRSEGETGGMTPAWTLLIAAIATAIAPPDAPRSAWVTADIVDVLDVPDDAAFSTGRLARGRRVVVRREGPDGWLTIAPPDGSFSLVDESDLEDLGDD